MSWKSFVTAGLLCVLATPAFAAPQIRVVPGGTNASGHLNAAGNWVWNVQVRPDMTLAPIGGENSGKTPLAVELGLQVSGASLVSVTAPNTAVWDKVNPGTAIPSFTGGTHASCGAAYNNNPCGLQSNAAAGTIFAAFGSTLLEDDDFETLLVIETSEPIHGTSSLDTTIQVLGAYGGDAVVAQATGWNGTDYIATVYDGFSHPGITRTARAGDNDLNGFINIDDYQRMLVDLSPAGQGTRQWYSTDFNGDGNTNIDDYQLMLVGLSPANNTYVVGAGATLSGVAVPPPGSGASAAVPEPASMALVGLALLGGMGLIRRR